MTYDKKIAIVYLLYYHNEQYVDDMVSAVKKLTYPKDNIELIVVSNPHPKEGSVVPYIEDTVLDMLLHNIKLGNKGLPDILERSIDLLQNRN